MKKNNLFFILLAFVFFLASCGKTVYWNKNNQPDDLLATIELVWEEPDTFSQIAGFSSGSTMWVILAIDNEKLEEPLYPGQSSIRISTDQKHTFQVAMGQRVLGSGFEQAGESFAFQLNYKLLPDEEYIFVMDMNSFSPTERNFQLRKPDNFLGFKGDVLKEWTIKLKDGVWVLL